MISERRVHGLGVSPSSERKDRNCGVRRAHNAKTSTGFHTPGQHPTGGQRSLAASGLLSCGVLKDAAGGESVAFSAAGVLPSHSEGTNFWACGTGVLDSMAST